MTSPEEHADQIRTLATDLRTLGQRALDEAETDMPTAEASLIQVFDLFTAAREAGVLP